MALQQNTLTIHDRSREDGTMRFHTLDTITTGLTDLITTIQDLSLGVVAKRSATKSVTISNAYPTVNEAQREKILQVSYQDNVTLSTHTTQIPAIDMSLLTFLGATDMVDIATGDEMIAFVTAFNANVKSPLGNAVTVLSAEFQGRNL